MTTLRNWKASQQTGGLAFFRALVGLIQGAVLYALYYALDGKLWPSQNMSIFFPLVLAGAFLPVLLLVGIGTIGRRTLSLWVLIAGIAVTAFSYYDIWRTGDLQGGEPSGSFVASVIAALFLAHSFMAGAAGTGRLIAPYANYFDAVWKQFIQLALSGLFTVVLWMFLHLGGELFHLIGINQVRNVMDEEWFFIPVTALAFALAIHVTDMRSGIVNGIRALAHTLLAWLLPVMALLVFAFLLALPFTGLAPLWDMRSATVLLVVAAAVLVLLINAVYQDGATPAQPPALLRVTATASSLALTPLVALSVYALGLRIAQYGLTPERIIASACLLLGGLFALGYGLSIFWRHQWLRGLEATNIAAAGLVITLLAALFSPFADPARLSVWDQTRRLEAGLTPLDKFDFKFLRFSSQRFGPEALERLKKSANAQIAKRAGEADRLESIYDELPVTSQLREKNITVYPAGHKLPASLLATDWRKSDYSYKLPSCLLKDEACEARLINLDDDPQKEVLIWGGKSDPVAFLDEQDGVWRDAGQFYIGYCDKAFAELRSGNVKGVPVRWLDVELLGHHIRIEPHVYDSMPAQECVVP